MNKQKHIIVLGAGLVGVSTAFALAKDGHKVSVIDRSNKAALGTSFANGGHIATGDALPWTSFNFLRRLLVGMWKDDVAAKLHLRAEPEQWIWLFKMLTNLSTFNWKYRAHSLLALADFSQTCFENSQRELNDDDYKISSKGILHLFSNRNAIKNAAKHKNLMQHFGVECEMMSGKEAISKEPALTKAVQYKKVGAVVFFPNDKTGDAKLWTQALAKLAEKNGVKFHFDQNIEAITSKNSKLISVLTRKKEIHHEIKGDIFILALGTESPNFTKHFGLRLPVYPVQGYSITMHTNGAHAPSMGLVDEQRRVVISKLGNSLRLAGLSDIGMVQKDRELRAQLLLRAWQDIIPESADLRSAQFWTGGRPMTPDSLPILGKSDILENLYLNTGHGALGWTLCHGSAQLIADLIARRAPAIDTTPFSLSRFN